VGRDSVGVDVHGWLSVATLPHISGQCHKCPVVLSVVNNPGREQIRDRPAYRGRESAGNLSSKHHRLRCFWSTQEVLLSRSRADDDA
jgi:hypothetical protein